MLSTMVLAKVAMLPVLTVLSLSAAPHSASALAPCADDLGCELNGRHSVAGEGWIPVHCLHLQRL
jgi:hypothetical protein